MEFTDEQQREIKKAYFFLTEYRKTLEIFRKKEEAVDSQIVQEYKEFIDSFNIIIPGTFEQFNENDFLRRDSPFLMEQSFDYQPKYKIDSLLVRTIKDVSALNVLMDEDVKPPMVLQKDFSFVDNQELRQIIRRDYGWIGRCLAVEAWKPLIILCGGLIEAILLDKLIANKDRAKSSTKAHKEKDLVKWSLEHLIDVSVDLSIINPGAEKLGDAVRNYRNLVHPGKELESGLQVKPEEGRIAFEILNMIIRDLEA